MGGFQMPSTRPKPRSQPAASSGFEQAVAALAARMARSPRRWPLRKARRYFEHLYTMHVLDNADGDRNEAAAILSISLSGFKEKVRSRYLRE